MTGSLPCSKCVAFPKCRATYFTLLDEKNVPPNESDRSNARRSLQKTCTILDDYINTWRELWRAEMVSFSQWRYVIYEIHSYYLEYNLTSENVENIMKRDFYS